MPRTVPLVECHCESRLSNVHPSVYCIEKHRGHNSIKTRLFISRAVPTKHQLNQGICLPIINPTDRIMTITRNTQIAQAEAIKSNWLEEQETQTKLKLPEFPPESISDEDLHKRVERSGLLENSEKTRLFDFLSNSETVFCRRLRAETEQKYPLSHSS